MGKRIIDLKQGDTLQIGETVVQLKKKSGQLARLSIEADKNIDIHHIRIEVQSHG